MARKPRGDERARMEDLGGDPGQVGPDSGGQSGDPQGLSSTADSIDQSVEELADTDQASEAVLVEGVEDAATIPDGRFILTWNTGGPTIFRRSVARKSNLSLEATRWRPENRSKLPPSSPGGNRSPGSWANR
jgi:hypothetical protein